MGKKSKSNRKALVHTPIKHQTDKESKAFISWAETQLSQFQLLPDEKIEDFVKRLIFFWADNNDNTTFFQYTRSLEFIGVLLWQKVGQCIVDGAILEAKVWLATLHIAIHLKKDPRDKHAVPNKVDLLEILQWIEQHEEELKCGDISLTSPLMQHPLSGVYYYAKSRVRLTQWSFVSAEKMNEYNQHSMMPVVSISAPRVLITVICGGDSLGRSPICRDIFVIIDIKVTTLVRLMRSYLNITSDDYKIMHTDDRGMPLIVIPSILFDETLEQRGIRSNHKLSIHFKKPSLPTKAKPPRSQKKKSTRQEKKQPVSRHSVPGSLSSNKRGSRCSIGYSTNVNQDKITHSKLLTLVFEEASGLFQERRKLLNDLAIKKSSPKQKLTKSRPNTTSLEPVSHCWFPENEARAGKTFFTVLIGHEEFLYKSSKSTKHSQSSPRTIDLHGCTKEEALQKLNNCMSHWMEEAMKGHPWTLSVNIICGGGCQIISSAVEQWIRESRNAAKRFT